MAVSKQKDIKKRLQWFFSASFSPEFLPIPFGRKIRAFRSTWLPGGAAPFGADLGVGANMAGSDLDTLNFNGIYHQKDGGKPIFISL